MVQLQLRNPDLTMREEAAEARILDGMVDSGPIALDPYAPEWDGILPIEDDPLTAMRKRWLTLEGSIRFTPEALALDPFGESGAEDR